MERKLFVLTGVIVSLFIVSTFSGCSTGQPWSTYTSKNFGYSIEYPSGWSVSEPFQNGQMVIIKSPDERDTISVLVSDSKGRTLDQMVNNYVYMTQKGSYSYKLLTDENINVRGIPARQLEIVYQSQKDSPTLSVRELYLIEGDNFYLVRFSTRLPDLTSLLDIHQHVFTSFQLKKKTG